VLDALVETVQEAQRALERTRAADTSGGVSTQAGTRWDLVADALSLLLPW